MRLGGNHDHNYLLHIRTTDDTDTCGKSVCNQGGYTRHNHVRNNGVYSNSVRDCVICTTATTSGTKKQASDLDTAAVVPRRSAGSASLLRVERPTTAVISADGRK